MRTEKEKMLAEELYDPLDPQLCDERRRARLLLNAFNGTRDEQDEERSRLIKELIPSAGAGVWIEPPFYCDYGSHIILDGTVFFNFNCAVLDVATVRIGSGVRIGKRSVVGAGSVVIKDVPDMVFAAGNPCRTLRQIE